MKNPIKLSITLLAILSILILAIPFPISAADQSNYPSSLAGSPVIYIQTPENTPSLANDMVILTVVDQLSKTADESYAKFSHLDYLANNELPKGWVIEVIGGSDATKENFERRHQENVEQNKKNGPRVIGPIESKNGITELQTDGAISPLTTGYASFALVGNNDPQSQTISAQRARWNAPTCVGSLGNSYCGMLDNGVTNSGWFIQSGQVYDSTHGRNVWATSAEGYVAQDFTNLPYYAGDLYKFNVSCSVSGVCSSWCENLSKGTYSYVLLSGVTGTSFVKNTGTSVFFENYNTNANWYTGFTNPISVTYCEDYTPLSYKAWNGQYIVILDNTGASQSNNGKITGSLINYGTAQWHLNLLLLGR